MHKNQVDRVLGRFPATIRREETYLEPELISEKETSYALIANPRKVRYMPCRG